MWVPFWTLFKKEVIRFLKVWMHTVLAPVLTGGLYLFVFGEALSKHLPVYEGVTYTADTLVRLRELYPENVEFYFITGADAIIDIISWRDAARIAQLAHLVGATRPGYDLESARASIAASGIDFKVSYLEVPALAISSSDLRARVASGQSLRYLTSDAVLGYIEKRGLYEAPRPAYTAPDALGLIDGFGRDAL